MNCELRMEIASIVSKLFEDGKTPSQKYGIDGDKIERVEQENPHVSKQYPWQGQSRKVA
jgi:hypothetical protein